MLLVLDTCTERMIVGLRASDGSDQWINLDAQGNHARDLLPAVESVLVGRRPHAVGVAVGPGSFTGVRIGLSTAKGLAEGWGVPLIGLDNLAAMADAWTRLVPGSEAAVLSIIDARKQKFYGALFQGLREVLPPADRSAAAWVDAVNAVWPAGVVVSGYQGSLLSEALPQGLPPHWTVLDVRDWAPGLLNQVEEAWKAQRFLPGDASPRYLRLSEAEENLRSKNSGH